MKNKISNYVVYTVSFKEINSNVTGFINLLKAIYYFLLIEKN